MLHYILDDQGKPKKVSETEWADWLETHRTTIAVTQIGKWHVKTEFKSCLFGDVVLVDPPIWETKVHSGPLHDDTLSCGGTQADALKMHEQMVQRVKKLLEHQQN